MSEDSNWWEEWEKFNKFQWENGRPPVRCPESQGRWENWLKSLSSEERRLEMHLHLMQVKSYGRYSMKGANDSTGREVHLEDVVERDGKEAIVVSILSIEEVQICPVGAGLPEIVHPASLTIRHSFIEKLKALSTNQELLDILASVEKRQVEARVSSKKSTSSGSGPRVAKKLEVLETEEV